MRKIVVFSLVLLWLIYPATKECMSDIDTGIPIIMYHNISPKSRLVGEYCVSVDEFEKDLKHITQNGYTTVSIQQLIDYSNNQGALPPKPIVITFDDGQESFYTYAYPLLKKYNCCAVMNIVGKFTDDFTQAQDHNVDYSYLNWQEVKELCESGIVEIGNHTYDMHEISSLRKGCGIKANENPLEYCTALNEDIGKLQVKLQDFTGLTCKIFAYPYGYISSQAPEILKEMGFCAMLTCEEKINYTSKEDWIYSLGRFNRSGKISSEAFFQKLEK